jgi:hypothetical protein
LNWFLRDFGYDTELLDRDEVAEKQLVGLKGVVKISHVDFNGASLLRLDGFAPASRWAELSPANLPGCHNRSPAPFLRASFASSTPLVRPTSFRVLRAWEGMCSWIDMR